MKRIAILLAVMLPLMTVTAQNTEKHYVDASLGLGLHTLFLGAENAETSAGMGFGLSAMYTYQITNQVAIGGGLSIGSLHSSAKFNMVTVENSKLLPGAIYAGRVTTTFDDWLEKQNIIYLGVPVEVFYYLNTESALFRFGAGLQLNMPLWSEYKATSGQYTRTLYLAETGITYTDMPSHKLGTYMADNKGSFGANVGLGIIYDAGIFFYNEADYSMYVGLYGMIGLNTMADAGVSDLFDDDYNYQGMPNSIYVEHTIPFEFGIKFTVRFGLHQKE